MPTEITSLVILELQQAWDEGCPIAQSAEVMAPVAIRRWQPAKRRRVPLNDRQARIKDLAKGLIEKFEPELSLVGPLRADYEFIAAKIAHCLLDQDEAADVTQMLFPD